MEEGTVQFVANYSDWKAVRKITITEKTDPKTIMEFLAGMMTSVDSRIAANLRKKVALDKLDAAIDELALGKGDATKALEEITSRKVNAVINEITTLPELQKNEQKELAGFCKVYAVKKALKTCGLIADYSEIEIPGMSRLKKKKAD